MTTTWDEAITPITEATYRDALLEELEDAGSDINGWGPDAPQLALVEGEARALAYENTISVQLAKTASTSTAIEAGDSWVNADMSWFAIEREPATNAVWSIPFKANPPPLTVDSTNSGTIQLQSSTGIIFQCTQQAAVSLDNSTATYMQFTARLPGTSGNVAVGSITAIISGPSALELQIHAEFPHVQTVVARDEETSADFITRGLGRWGVIGPSTDSALGSAGWTRTSLDYLIPLFGNTDTTSVTRWRVDDANPNGPGTVEIALADAAGPASAATLTAVYDGLNGDSVKPVGSGEITVIAASAYVLAITATIQTDGTVAGAVTKAAAEAAIGTLSEVFPLGTSRLTTDLVRAILMGTPIVSAAVATGTTDKTIQLDLAGFAGVEEITACSFAASVDLAPGDVLQLSATVTVLT